MQAEQKTINKTHLLDKIRGNKKQIGLAALVILLIGFVFFREIMLQVGALILAFAVAGYVLFKAGLFAFAISYGLIRKTLSLVAILLALIFIFGTLARL